MRISTSMMHTLSLQSIQTQQEALMKTQTQLSTGKKILTPSDAPSDAMRVIERTQYIGRLEQYDRVISHAQGELGQQDTLLGQASDLLQSIRDSAVQLNNDTYTTRERKDAAAAIRGQIRQMIDLANSQDTTGNFLFSGYKGDTRPFLVDASGHVVYQGDEGVRMLKLGEAQEVQSASNGKALFMQVPSGNGTFETKPGALNTGIAQVSPGSVTDPSLLDLSKDYTLTFQVISDPVSQTQLTYYNVKDSDDNVIPDDLGTQAFDAQDNPILDGAGDPLYVYKSGQAINFNGMEFRIEDQPADGDTFTVRPSSEKSVFDILGDLADTLESFTGLPEELGRFHNQISSALSEIDQASDVIITERSRVGIRLNSADSVQLAYSSLTFVHQSNISKLRDTDYAEAASNLARQMQSLDAMQATYGKIKDLSLFNFI